MKMKAKGLSAKAGDVIPYIFCVPPNGETTKTAQAANAHHPDDVRRQGSTLKIGACALLSSSLKGFTDHRIRRLRSLPLDASPAAHRASLRAHRGNREGPSRRVSR